MCRSIQALATGVAALALAGCSTMGGMSGSGTAQNSTQKETQLASRAQTTLEQQMSKPAAKRIPAQLMADARCVAVFPSVLQAGFIVGGRHGQGLVTCRQKSGGFASAQPAIYSLSAGSIGLQAGASKSSVILLFMTQQSVDSLFQSGIKYGSQISATAGKTGYDQVIAQAPAPIVAYATSSKGLFAGINVNGSKLTFNQSENAALYGPQVTPRGILLGQVNKASAMAPYLNTLQQFAPSGGSGTSNQGSGSGGSQSNSGQSSQHSSGSGQSSSMSGSGQSNSNPQQSGSGQSSQMSGAGQSQSGQSKSGNGGQPQPSGSNSSSSNAGQSPQPSGSGQSQPNSGQQQPQQSGSNQSQ